MLELTRFEALTFDCYGTIIDWETGILRALRPFLESHGWVGTDDAALELFATVESRIQGEEYIPYVEVLRGVVDQIARSLHVVPTPEELECLSGSVGDWPAFADSVEALSALGTRYRLAIVSNIDDELFELSNRRLGIDWDVVVTAQQVGSYKPAHKHFHEAVARLRTPVEEVLHVAQSLYHDVAPASQLGFRTVWVNRRVGREGGGATPVADAEPDLEVPDLATLAGLCGV